MATFDSFDGTTLAYHRSGDGRPLVFLPGGPMMASEYLGDLGGLSARYPVVRLDLRGTGESAAPADPSTYRIDHQIADVEALREHLGLDQLDLAGHSAGGSLAVLYATSHPDRVRCLALVDPSPRAVGVEVADEDRRELVELRRGEPWFPQAYAAFQGVWAGQPTEADWAGVIPFTYGRWDEAAQLHASRAHAQRNADAAARYYSDGAFDVDAVRAALGRLTVPVLLMTGEYDVALPPKSAAGYAALFPDAELVVQPGGGHYPWLDDADWFVRTLLTYLR